MLDIHNQIDGTTDGFATANVILQSNGSVTHSPNFQLTAFCGLDHTNWPFDQHTCTFVFEARINKESMFTDVNLVEDAMAPDLISSEWRLLTVSIAQDTTKNNYNEVSLKISVARKTNGYTLTLFAPVTVIVVLTLCAFWLPVQAGEKILLNGIVGALVNMYMLYFAEKLPNMGTSTPLVVKFCCFTLYITIFSMMVSILVLAMSRTKHSYGTPYLITKMLESGWAKFLLLSFLFANPGGDKREPNRDVQIGREFQIEEDFVEEEEEEEENREDAEVTVGKRESIPSMTKMRNSLQKDWILLATLIDRIAFIICSLMFVAIAIAYNV